MSKAEREFLDALDERLERLEGRVWNLAKSVYLLAGAVAAGIATAVLNAIMG